MGSETGHDERNLKIKDIPTQVRDWLDHPVLLQSISFVDSYESLLPTGSVKGGLMVS